MNDEKIKEIVDTFAAMYLDDLDVSAFCDRCAAALFGYALGQGYMGQDRYYKEQSIMENYIRSAFLNDIKAESLADQIIEGLNNEA